MTQPLTDKFLANLDRLDAAGSKQWRIEHNVDGTIKSVRIQHRNGSVVAATETEEGEWDDEMERDIDADLNLAVAARNALPVLLAEIRRLRGSDVPVVVGKK
jgi:hypothetical protein